MHDRRLILGLRMHVMPPLTLLMEVHPNYPACSGHATMPGLIPEWCAVDQQPAMMMR